MVSQPPPGAVHRTLYAHLPSGCPALPCPGLPLPRPPPPARVQAGGLDALSANPRLLKEAVVFASAAGASTTTRPGAIEGQPTLAQVEELYAQSEKWYNFW